MPHPNSRKYKEGIVDKRAVFVEERVKELMAEEYSPFLPNNVTKALSELSFADSCLMASYIQMCADHPDNVDNHVHLADFVVDRVQDYWHTFAVKHAQELYDKELVSARRNYGR